MTQSRRFHDPRTFDGLTGLVEAWTDIREEFRRHRFEGLSIDRVGKTHEQVFHEVASHMEAGGAYGWLKGWGPDGAHDRWTQLGLVIDDRPVPFLGRAFPKTLSLLSDVPGVKVAAFIRLAPDGFLGTHRHPELREEGLLQMHLTLEAADEANYAYLNVEGEFRRHVPGEGFVFDGSLDHFALNASPEDRVILYLEFRPSPSR